MVLDNFRPLILNAGKAEKMSDWNFRNVSSPFARIYYVTEGRASVKLNGQEYELSPRHLYLIPPFTMHDNICKEAFSHYYAHVYEDPAVNGTGSIFDSFDFPIQIMAQEIDGLLFERLVKMNPQLGLDNYNPESYNDNQSLRQNIDMEKKMELGRRLETRSILLFFFSRFLLSATEKQADRDERISRVIQFIVSRLPDTELEDGQLAEMACLSVNQFIRRFKKETGLTPLQFITNRRIERAQILLLKSEMDNKNIAYAVGYNDPAYFCKMFKRIVGVSPQQYRSYTFNHLFDNQSYT